MKGSAMVSRGLLAGLLGGAVIAVWFLLIDASQGQPFRTPAFIASALAGRQTVDISPGLVLGYSLLHFGAFAGVGIAVAWLASRFPVTPGTLTGLILGFLLFDLVFYGSVIVAGVDVVAELGWPEVLTGNLLAGLAVMKFLHMTGAAKPTTWWQTLEEHETVKEGLIAGILGALVVAVWFLVVDVVRGEALFTPAALGSALFMGARNLQQVEISALTVVGYSVVHFAVFGAAGLLAAAIARQAEEQPQILLGGLVLFVAFEALFLGLLAVVAEFLLGPLAWWAIAIGNVLATVVMGYYIWRSHPAIHGTFDDQLFNPENDSSVEKAAA